MRKIVGIKSPDHGFVDVTGYNVRFTKTDLELTDGRNVVYSKRLRDLPQVPITFSCDDGAERSFIRRGTNQGFIDEVNEFLESDFYKEYYGEPT